MQLSTLQHFPNHTNFTFVSTTFVSFTFVSPKKPFTYSIILIILLFSNLQQIDGAKKAREQIERRIKQHQADRKKMENEMSFEKMLKWKLACSELEKLRTTIAEMEKSDVELTAKYERLKQEVLFLSPNFYIFVHLYKPKF